MKRCSMLGSRRFNWCGPYVANVVLILDTAVWLGKKGKADHLAFCPLTGHLDPSACAELTRWTVWCIAVLVSFAQGTCRAT